MAELSRRAAAVFAAVLCLLLLFSTAPSVCRAEEGRSAENGQRDANTLAAADEAEVFSENMPHTIDHAEEKRSSSERRRKRLSSTGLKGARLPRMRLLTGPSSVASKLLVAVTLIAVGALAFLRLSHVIWKCFLNTGRSHRSGMSPRMLSGAEDSGEESGDECPTDDNGKVDFGAFLTQDEAPAAEHPEDGDLFEGRAENNFLVTAVTLLVLGAAIYFSAPSTPPAPPETERQAVTILGEASPAPFSVRVGNQDFVVALSHETAAELEEHNLMEQVREMVLMVAGPPRVGRRAGLGAWTYKHPGSPAVWFEQVTVDGVEYRIFVAESTVQALKKLKGWHEVALVLRQVGEASARAHNSGA